MKYTVSLVLLVAIGLAEPFDKQEDDDNQSAKRELLEGNYGLRIQPSVSVSSSLLESQRVNSGKYSQKNVPAQEYGPPRQPHKEYGLPVAKISDELTKQGLPSSAAIADHLYSPVYQPRVRQLKSFEISSPVPSELRYAEHKITGNNFQQTLKQNFESLEQPYFNTHHQNNEKREDLRNTNKVFGSSPGQPLIITNGNSYENQENHILNFEPQKMIKVDETKERKLLQQDDSKIKNQQNFQHSETSKQTDSEIALHDNTLPDFSELRSPQLALSNVFLPRLEQFELQSRPIYSKQIIEQVFPQIEGYSDDFFQQINELGNQFPHNTVQYFQYSEDEQTIADEDKKIEIEDDNSSQLIRNTSVTPTSTPIPIQYTQAVSYARFSQGLPASSTPLPQLQPLPLPQLQQQFQPFSQAQIIQSLQHLQPPQLFGSHLSPQPIQESTPQPHLQPVFDQPLFQPLPPKPTQQPLTSAAPFQNVFTDENLKPQRIGVISIRQETNLRNQSSVTTSSQNEPIITNSQNIFTTKQPQFSSSPQIILNSEPTLVTQGLSSEVTVSTTIAPRITSKSSGQLKENPTTATVVAIIPALSAKTSVNPTISPRAQQSTSPFQVFVTSTSSPALPPRPDSEVPISTIPSTIQPFTTSAPISQSQQSFTTLQTLEPQISLQTTQPETPTSHPDQILTSQQPTLQQLVPLQPFPTLPPLPPIHPLTALKPFSFPLSPKQVPTIQQFSAVPKPLPPLQSAPEIPQPLPTFLPAHVIPQPLPTLQPYLIQPLPPQETPRITVVPIQQYPIQTESQQIVAQKQHQIPLIVQPVQQEYQAQIQLQPTPSPPSQQIQIQVQPQLVQRLSQYQPAPQQPQSPQSQSEETKQSHHKDQVKESERKEAAIAHAHQLLYGLYSPFIQQPVYSESQEIAIQPQAAPIVYPASSYPMLFATPALSPPQFFGKFAHDIFGRSVQHYKKK